jgi:F-type H+-transporting ATPase subunit delta
VASIAIRYARAFADVVIELKVDTAQVREELRSLVDMVSGSSDLRGVLESPMVQHEEKMRLLDAISQRAGFQTVVRNFMAVLIEHHHTAALPAIARQFQLELNKRLGLVEAEITSVRELSAGEKTALENRVAQLTGLKVLAQYGTDQSLLGGAVVKVGSTIYDGSLRGQLRRIKEQLSAG